MPGTVKGMQFESKVPALLLAVDLWLEVDG